MRKIKIPKVIFRYVYENPTPGQMKESLTRVNQTYDRLFKLALKKLVEGHTKISRG